MSLHVAFLFHYSYINDLLQLVLWPSFLLCLLHSETIASYRNVGQQDMNLCAIRQCRLPKILERRKSRVCSLNYLLLVRKCAFANWEPLTFPHVCLFWSFFFFFTQKHQVLCSFSLHQARIWLPTRGREAFVLTKWDNWSDKTIVSNNILLPPPSLQSSRIMWPLSSTISSCHRNYVNWSFIMLIECVANKVFICNNSGFIVHISYGNKLLGTQFYKLECHNILR